MPHGKKILYAVSSVGLGHIRRSIAIAKELKGLEINWLTAEPALSYLRDAGEKNILEISSDLRSVSTAMEGEARDGRITDMSRVARASSRIAKENYFRLRSSLKDYDVLIEDEFAETMFSFLWDKSPPLPRKKVLITDYVRFETGSVNPINRLVLFYANRVLKKAFLSTDLRIFADDLESLPRNKKLRQWTMANFSILGPIVGELPMETKEELRQKFLTARGKNVIVFSIGGTSIGKPLLDFVFANAEELSNQLQASIVVLTGPRFSVTQGKNVQVVPFTTEALCYFKMADCVVTQAGASTLNELDSLGIPCVAIPIRNHWEQQANAKRFSEKSGSGVIQYSDLSIERLISEIKLAISRPENLKDSIALNQRKAANLILQFVENGAR
ncbi:MAG: glycosyltransferase [Nitrososphaerales archaeon]